LEVHNSYLIPAVIDCNSYRIETSFLIDSGALQKNFVSKEVANKLEEAGAVVCACTHRVCMAVDYCVEPLGVVSFNLIFTNEISLQKESITLDAVILEGNKYPLIIGLPTIRKYSLFSKFPSRFDDRPTETTRLSDRKLNSISPNDANLSVLVENYRRSVKELLTGTKDNDELDSFLHEDPWESSARNIFENETENTDHVSESFIMPKLFGSNELQARLRELILQYSDIFSTDLNSESADVQPLDIVVDEDKWHTRANMGSPRIMTTVKQTEIVKQLTYLQSLGVIVPSQVPYHSQVLLAPKPDGSWRMCVDYRRFFL
jgi:hypothetical protein